MPVWSEPTAIGTIASSPAPDPIKASADTDILAVPGDISKPETAERIVREGLERFGRIDSLVNNAGVFVSKPFTEFTQDDYAHNIGVNVAGFFHMTQRAAAEMLKQGSGHIVNITTSLVDQADGGVPAALASMTKGGLNSVTKALAIEFAEDGVRVNAVAPGIIKTPMHPVETTRPGRNASGRPDGRSPRYRRRRPLPRDRVLRDRRDPPCRWRPERRAS